MRILSMPTVANLDRAFPGKGASIHALIQPNVPLPDTDATRAYIGRCYNRPSNYLIRMTELDAIAETCGIEYAHAKGGRYPSFDYLNTGDPYTLTLVRFADGRYRVACWGDIVERGNYE